ncbi:MAG: DUF309 domain-containing protein [Isosphaeraceae bacterium]
MHDFPDYAYVPGGPWPHPTRGKGHAPARPDPIREQDWALSGDYLRGVALFNAGYYWEAHEVWEGLWHAHGRSGPTADLLKALIKLAAAGVKVRERQPRGAATHARRAAELLERVTEQAGGKRLGLDLRALTSVAREIAANPPDDPGERSARVTRVFMFRFVPE